MAVWKAPGARKGEIFAMKAIKKKLLVQNTNIQLLKTEKKVSLSYTKEKGKDRVNT